MNHNALSPEELIEVGESSLYNEDLAPIPRELRTWTKWNIAALWVAMCVSIPTYSLASGLITQGMNWKQAVATIFLGNLIILIPMSLNACPGTAFGIPFPVLLRSSFGTLGSNIPALMRGLVACGWFGIQTWIGGSAIYIDPIRKAFRACGLRFSATGGPAYGWQVSGFRLPALPMSRY